ncbi:hypothetical protein P5P81_04635 [Tritonibacter mobilis]|nr:hypothetical protein [Tritonibacter mobilis]
METVTFLGTHYRLGLTGLTDQRLFALHHGISAPVVGDTLHLSIPPEALICLPQH